MRVVIAGGHGKIALLLAELLTERGDKVGCLIRTPEQAADIAATGARAVVIDLEHAALGDVAAAIHGYDAVVFAAGAGPGSSAERKYTVDKGGSVLLATAAEQAGVRRFVQISTMGAAAPPAAGSDEIWAAYIDAKTQAEDDLRARELDWTILRPGRLLDVPATGLVTLGPRPLPRGTIPRADVATVLAGILHAPQTAGATLELISGAIPVASAIKNLDNQSVAEGGTTPTD
ncbi:SDR family oxidoreductase [Nocardia sp. NPDC051463]|uniref:SDR family oxidoreductase n=1 Tax=Nocardia sp. NPDC051463 TaxID=3154845 RepID=UPI003439F2A5